MGQLHHMEFFLINFPFMMLFWWGGFFVWLVFSFLIGAVPFFLTVTRVLFLIGAVPFVLTV